jgi:hypothetical protein
VSLYFSTQRASSSTESKVCPYSLSISTLFHATLL